MTDEPPATSELILDQTDCGRTRIERRFENYADEKVWLSQKMMAQLYDVEVRTINYHLKKVFADSELEQPAVIRISRITASDGKTYDTRHSNLSAIFAEEDLLTGATVRRHRIVQTEGGA